MAGSWSDYGVSLSLFLSITTVWVGFSLELDIQKKKRTSRLGLYYFSGEGMGVGPCLTFLLERYLGFWDDLVFIIRWDSV